MRTQTSTIVGLICELIETHMEKCDAEAEPGHSDHVPHVVSEVHNTKSDIKAIENSLIGNKIIILMEDGAKFAINVEKIP